MNYVIIQSSEILKWNRMDARFFIALHSIESRYNELKKTVPEDVIQQQLALLTPKEKEPCLVLGRGQGGTDQTNGHTLHAGPFRVDRIEIDGTLKAGCHTITFDAMSDLAERLGW